MVNQVLKEYAHWVRNDKASNRLDSDCDGSAGKVPGTSGPSIWPE